MKKRSPPPPPDRPLNIHSTAYRPSHDFTEPNWGKWKLYDNVRLWIAACLLANIDPPADTYELDGYPANFKEIWNIINSDGEFANVPNLPLDGRRNYVASLRGFAAWAINKGIENIPETMLEWGHQRLKLLAEIKAMPEQNIEPVTSAAPPPVSKPQAAPASEPVTPAAVLTLPPAEGITKQQVLIAFEALVKPFDLKKALGNGKGLYGETASGSARTQKGTRGAKHAALWNPVILAIGLRDKYSVPMLHLKNAFNDHSFLRKWADEWRSALDLLGE